MTRDEDSLSKSGAASWEVSASCGARGHCGHLLESGLVNGGLLLIQDQALARCFMVMLITAGERDQVSHQ